MIKTINNLPTEEEFLKQWGVGHDFDPLVQIRCNCFNQVQYIESAILGFLRQQTNFPFIIQVHDDASTDGSQTIIKKYAALYPHIIHSILEKENLWSKKDGSLSEQIRKCPLGKYVAICEGDDYWVDEHKLQMQVDYMETHPFCSFTFTNGYIEDQVSTPIRREDYFDIESNNFTAFDQEINLDNVFEILFPPTASYMYVKKYEKGIMSVPICPAGDLRTRLYYLTKGEGHYFSAKTCVYRKNVPNSAMSTWKKDNCMATYTRSTKIIQMIDYINQITQEMHSTSLYKIAKIHYHEALISGYSLKLLRDKQYKKIFNEQSLIVKVKIIIKLMFFNKLMDFIGKRKYNAR